MAEDISVEESKTKICSFQTECNSSSPSKSVLLASSRGHHECLQNILTQNHEINVNIHSTNTRHTPLTYACKKGYLDVATILIGNGANVKMTTKWHNDTPLSLAAYFFHFDICELLLDNGADMAAV